METLKSKLIEEIGNNTTEVQALLDHFTFANYYKGEHLKNSNTEDYLFFISSGFVRIYYLTEHKQNNEINIAFIPEDNFITDVDYFFGNGSRKLKIQALENVTTYRRKKEEYDTLVKKFPIIEKFAINRLLEFSRQLLKKDYLL
jgi:CRP-like cAMP-binding protein